MSSVGQLIADATAAITTRPGASTMRTLLDPVRAGERDNYICAWWPALDMLTLSVPRPGEPCRFRLIVSPGAGRWDAVSYVIQQADEVLWRADRRADGDVWLTPAGDSGLREITALIQQASMHESST